MNYEEAMKRAFELAVLGSGRVSPNPRVGAVILRNGEIISEGYHHYYGGPHAEVDAINNATVSDFSDCTLIVTLEPCSHFGKTPPCADLIVEKGFERVVLAMSDPNPLVAGRGTERIRNAGIEVISGVLEEEARWINRFFIKNINDGAPYIILKIAQSLNGAIASSDFESKWITSEESRRRTHALRATVDVVLIGKNTAIKDDPELTVRHVRGVNPKRVLLDTNLSSSSALKLFNDEQRDRTIVFCSEQSFYSEKAMELSSKGVQLAVADLDDSGRLALKSVFELLHSRFDIHSVMVEGGAEIYSKTISEGLADEIQLFQAPIVIGKGINAFGNFLTSKIGEAPRFRLVYSGLSGGDLHSIWKRVVSSKY